MIKVLSEETIDKIAAGEVVENPSSVVKELCENAIDAGAGQISVEIRDGGLSLIRVTDNGCGIPKDQVTTAFLRHATSKITCIEDLQTAMSLGFRGEALSSIAAVGQVEIITKTKDSLTGTRFTIEGSDCGRLMDVGAPDGTTFVVRNLFFNTPVRRKFLKTSATEGAYVADLMEHLALSRPDISFMLQMGGKMRLQTGGSGDLKEVIFRIYGREITGELVRIDAESPDGLKLWGYLAKPVVTRNNRSNELFFVNGRTITSKVLQNAAEEAYKPFLMQHKFPFFVLHLSAEGSEVDANVHPRKAEVRFSDNIRIYNFVRDAIAAQLRQIEMIPQAVIEGEGRQVIPAQSTPSGKEASPVTVVPVSSEFPTVAQFPGTREIPFAKEIPVAAEDSAAAERSVVKPPEPFESMRIQEEGTSYDLPENLTDAKQMDLFEDRLLTKEARASYRIIGQVFDTYWMIEYQEKLLIIDQHAAHEKVLFEKFMKQFRENGVSSQQIFPPVIVTLTARQEAALLRFMEDFTEMGFEISHFGGKDYSITAMPEQFSDIRSSDLFAELLDDLSENEIRSSGDMIHDRIATKACKAAVKGNNHLTVQEAEALIDQLLSLENPYHCPHGRPTIISMSKYEMDKKFKRIL